MSLTPKSLKFFPTETAFRKWLESNHSRKSSLWVGYWKKSSGKKGISYDEAVRAALAYGWIDGQGMRIDEESHTNRFTPRKAGSNWSLANVKRVRELKRAGRMRPAGLLAFEKRDRKKTGLYSFEQGKIGLDAATKRRLMSHAASWKFFRAQAPSYQRVVTWWLISAKKPETKERRIVALIKHSKAGKRLPQFVSPGNKYPADPY